MLASRATVPPSTATTTSPTSMLICSASFALAEPCKVAAHSRVTMVDTAKATLVRPVAVAGAVTSSDGVVLFAAVRGAGGVGPPPCGVMHPTAVPFATCTHSAMATVTLGTNPVTLHRIT